jgi:hypothetical protein
MELELAVVPMKRATTIAFGHILNLACSHAFAITLVFPVPELPVQKINIKSNEE